MTTYEIDPEKKNQLGRQSCPIHVHPFGSKILHTKLLATNRAV